MSQITHDAARPARRSFGLADSERPFVARPFPALVWGLVATVMTACAEVPAPQELKVLSVPSTAQPSNSAAAETGDGPIRGGRDVVLLEQARGQVVWLEALLEEVKARAARGEVSETDVAQVESRLAAAKARRAALRGTLAISCARYQELVGQPAPSCVE